MTQLAGLWGAVFGPEAEAEPNVRSVRGVCKEGNGYVANIRVNKKQIKV